MQYFNIQVASQLSGVASATIRAWEKRYNAVIPDRGDNGHRLYSEKDIEKLALLFKLTEVGQSIGKIAHLQLEDLKQVYSTLLHEPYNERHLVNRPQERVGHGDILSNLLLALRSYKVDVISHELEKARANLSPRELALRIILPLFREIGLRTKAQDLSLAQERLISSLVFFYLGQLLGEHYQRPAERDGIILVGTPEGEHHEIGAFAAALLLAHYGYRFIYLGANLPASVLAKAALELGASAVLLGGTRWRLRDEHFLESYLSKLLEELRGKTSLWIGGEVGALPQKLRREHTLLHFPTLEALDGFLVGH